MSIARKDVLHTLSRTAKEDTVEAESKQASAGQSVSKILTVL